MNSSSARRTTRLLAVSALVAVGIGAAPAGAVNADHGVAVVSANPANVTPHVMNGSVNAITQVDNLVIAAGTFTKVSPAGTYTDTADVTRNRILAFDATTGAIDPRFDPGLGGAANSLSTDGTNVYVAGSFSSVESSLTTRRIAVLPPTELNEPAT
jgi:long-subunit fatty acid transport protein